MTEQQQHALALAKGLATTASNIERIAKECGVAETRWAFSQWELRRRARAKFTSAEDMLFTREALEQSTHERVAAYHASLFPPDTLVADLTCGIGADLIALARRGPCVGFETNSERAEYALHNLAVHGLDAEVIHTDCLAPEWTFEFAFADPSRRVDGKRTLDPLLFEPNLVELSARMATLKIGLIKLSPMLHDDFLTSLGSSVQFVSFGGECREALVFIGNTTCAQSVSAVHVESGDVLEREPLTANHHPPPLYFFDADPGAIRAGCLGTLCGRHSLAPLGKSNGYLVGDQPIESPWLRCYEIIVTLPFDRKRVREELRKGDLRLNEVKSRGVHTDAAKELRNLGDQTKGDPVSLCIYPDDRGTSAAIVIAVE